MGRAVALTDMALLAVAFLIVALPCLRDGTLVGCVLVLAVLVIRGERRQRDVDKILATICSPDGTRNVTPSAQDVHVDTLDGRVSAPADETAASIESVTHTGAAQAATSVESTAQDGEDLAAELVCPITHELMQDPVLTADGHAYERAAILRWFDEHDAQQPPQGVALARSPRTGMALASRVLVPAHALRAVILRHRRSRGLPDPEPWVPPPQALPAPTPAFPPASGPPGVGSTMIVIGQGRVPDTFGGPVPMGGADGALLGGGAPILHGGFAPQADPGALPGVVPLVPGFAPTQALGDFPVQPVAPFPRRVQISLTAAAMNAAASVLNHQESTGPAGPVTVATRFGLDGVPAEQRLHLVVGHLPLLQALADVAFNTPALAVHAAPLANMLRIIQAAQAAQQQHQRAHMVNQMTQQLRHVLPQFPTQTQAGTAPAGSPTVAPPVHGDQAPSGAVQSPQMGDQGDDAVRAQIQQELNQLQQLQRLRQQFLAGHQRLQQQFLAGHQLLHEHLQNFTMAPEESARTQMDPPPVPLPGMPEPTSSRPEAPVEDLPGSSGTDSGQTATSPSDVVEAQSQAETPTVPELLQEGPGSAAQVSTAEYGTPPEYPQQGSSDPSAEASVMQAQLQELFAQPIPNRAAPTVSTPGFAQPLQVTQQARPGSPQQGVPRMPGLPRMLELSGVRALSSGPAACPDENECFRAARADDAATLERMLDAAHARARHHRSDDEESSHGPVVALPWALQQNSAGDSLLHAAAWEGAEQVTRFLLARLPCMATCASSRDGSTPLHYAAFQGHAPVVRRLMAAGARLEARVVSSGETPLHFAARHGHAQACLPLLELPTSGAEASSAEGLSLQRADGCTPLFLASYLGHLDVVRILLRSGADPAVGNPLQHKSALHGCAEGVDSHANSDVSVAVMEALIEANADPNARARNGWRVLHSIAASGNASLCDLLLRRGASPSAASEDGVTPLVVAATFGHEAIVHSLASAGARASDVAADGTDALHRAIMRGHERVVMALLQVAGANPSARTSNGSTALHLACWVGLLAPARVLIDGVEVEDEEEGRRRLVRADMEARTEDGDSPLHQAVFRGHREIVNLLTSRGADLNAQKMDGDTPLHLCAKQGNVAMAQLLRASGARVDVRNAVGLLPLGVAQGNAELVEVLSTSS